MTSTLWNRVTVVGCGLIGASFALALREHHLCGRIAGWDSSEAVLNEALAAGIIDEVDAAFANGRLSASDLVYLALPVYSISEFLKKHGFLIRSGALVTDAGSTKVEICEAASTYLPSDCLFVGGHPIAGSHLSGLNHARPDLFNGQPYVLIAEKENVSAPQYVALQNTIQQLGARIVFMTASEHDHAMAYISHLPQLLASTLAATIGAQGNVELLESVKGPGYADMTRLALSNWSIWRDILLTNRQEISQALDQFIRCLQSTHNELASDPGDGSQLQVTRSLFQDSQEDDHRKCSKDKPSS